MEITLSIKCDSKHAPAILVAAQKIIEQTKQEAEHKIKKAAQLMFCSISVYEWERLEIHEKTKYICIDADANEWDIGIYDKATYGLRCELCTDEQHKEFPNVVGTRDLREPKYCFQHYMVVNEDSRFKKGDTTSHAKIRQSKNT